MASKKEVIIEDKKCIVCQNLFQVNINSKRSNNRETCSQSCSSKLGAMRSKKVNIECKVCKIEFEISKHNVQKDGNFCSDECRKKRYEHTCVVCESVFRSDRTSTKYCSLECNIKGTKEQLVDCKCACCNIIFQRPSFSAPSNKRLFCSRKCAQRQFARENPTRYGSNWSRIRERKVKKDNYTCNRCGERHTEPYGLNVHHIIPIEEFEKVEDAHFEGNLETLCFPCHMEHHDKECY